MFDVKGKRVVEFIYGLSESLPEFNKKMHPLHVEGITLNIRNRKDTYDFSSGISLVGDNIGIADVIKSDIIELKGIQEFYISLVLNDESAIDISVRDSLGIGKYAISAVSNDGTFRFMCPCMLKNPHNPEFQSLDFSSDKVKWVVNPKEFHKLLHPNYYAVFCKLSVRNAGSLLDLADEI